MLSQALRAATRFVLSVRHRAAGAIRSRQAVSDTEANRWSEPRALGCPSVRLRHPNVLALEATPQTNLKRSQAMPESVPYRREDDEDLNALKGMGWSVVAGLGGAGTSVLLDVVVGRTAGAVTAATLLLLAAIVAAQEVRRPRDQRMTAYGIPKWKTLRSGDAIATGLSVGGTIASGTALLLYHFGWLAFLAVPVLLALGGGIYLRMRWPSESA